MKKIFLFITTVLSLFLIISCGINNKKENSNESYLQSTDTITVTKNDYYYVFKPKEYNTGIVFYPKQNIDVISYAPLLYELASEGYITFLAKDYVINNKNVANVAYNSYDNVTEWYIGGHSSGGTAAADYLKDNHLKFSGLFLLSSYSNVDLSSTKLKFLSVYGNQDKLLDMSTYNKNLSNIGNNVIKHIIEGGNHSFFNGDTLENDGTATITNKAQRELTIKYIKALINAEAPKTPTLTPDTNIYPENEFFGIDGENLEISKNDENWNISYNIDDKKSHVVSFEMVNHDTKFDTLYIKLNAPKNTNLGVRLYYLDSSDNILSKDIIDCNTADGNLTLDGNQNIVIFLKNHNLQGSKIIKLELLFDCSSEYTINTGQVNIQLYQPELLIYKNLILKELNFSVETTTFNYTGNPIDLKINCSQQATFKVEYSKVLANNEEIWTTSAPINAGVYNVRITYAGSLQYDYKVITSTITINKIKADINPSDVTIDDLTRIITIKDGIIASLDSNFTDGSEVLNGVKIPYGTTIYYKNNGNENYLESDTLSYTFNKPLSLYKSEAISEIIKVVGNYDIDKAPYEASINSATTVDEVSEKLSIALADITAKKIEIDAAISLANAKTTAKAELESYKSLDLYRESEQTLLTEAINKGKNNIDSAVSIETVILELANAKSTIDKIKTKAEYENEEFIQAQALAEAKVNAIAQVIEKIGNYDIDKTPYENAINNATSIEEVEEQLIIAWSDIIDKKAEIDKANALAEAKVNAINQIIEAIGDYDIDKDPYVEVINNATSISDVKNQLSEAIKDITYKKAVIDNNTALLDAKAKAIIEIENYKSPDLYRENEKTILLQRISLLKVKLDEVSTIEEINTLVTNFKDNVDKLKTKAEYEAEEEADRELTNAKKDAITQIIEAIGDYDINSSNYENSINSSTTIFEVEEKLTAALIEIAEKKEIIDAEISLEQVKQNAKTEISNYKSLNLYREEEQKKLTNIISMTHNKIDLTYSIDSVFSVLIDGKTKIDALKTKAEYEAEELANAAKLLAEAKVNAINEITEAIGEYDIDNTDYEAAVNAATSIDEVNEILSDALNEIQTKISLIDAAIALAKAKATAKTNLQNYKNPDLYREAEQSLLNEAINNGILEIDAATSIDEVELVLFNAKSIMDTFKTKAQYEIEELKRAKDKALYRLMKEVIDYEINITSYEASINAATSVDEVDALLATALLEIEALKSTIDAAHALAEAKANAIVVINETIGDYDIDNNDFEAAINAATSVDEVEQLSTEILEEIELMKSEIDAAHALAESKANAIISIIEAIGDYDIDNNDFEAAINAATSIDEVNEILAATLKDIENQKSAIDAAKALESAKTTAKAELIAYKSANLYREAEQETLATAINNGKATIDAADSIEAVYTALTAAKNVIDTIKTKAQYEDEEQQAAQALAKAKVDAITEIIEAIGTYNIDSTAYVSSINAATTINEVEESLEEALNDINAKKTKIDEDANKVIIGEMTTDTGVPIIKNYKNEYILQYNKTLGYHTFDVQVQNWNSNLDDLKIIFTLNANTEVCFDINGKIDWSEGVGHEPHEAGLHTKIFTTDMYPLAENFTIKIYFDAEVEVTENKIVTIHYIGFGEYIPEEVEKPEGTVTVNYEESVETFVNPDRGFYYPICLTAESTGIEQLGSTSTQIFNNNLIHLRIDIAAFSKAYNQNQDLELTTEMLNGLDDILTTLNNAGVCIIIRFAYDRDFGGAVNGEPAINMILKHIEQFSPLINKHKNMITAVECGLVGPWGEMHSSVIANQTTYNKIFAKYLECLDEDVVLLVRRPCFIYEYYGLTVNELDKFDYENNRIGCYNDGYLGSASDLGTFVDREKEIAFLEKLAKFPYGGEVVRPESEYNHLSWACDEMFRTNLSYLNIQWNNIVIDRWQNTEYTLGDPLYKGQTEFTYIANHMGYRLVCESLDYIVDDNNILNFTLNIKNVGFGELLKPKKGFVILRDGLTEHVFEFDYNNELTIEQQIDLSNVDSGVYEFFFVLADDYNNSHAVRGIRFANTNMYDESNYSNKLANIVI